MSEEEPDLVKSTSLVGQLYPVLVDAEGKTIDGLHRQEKIPQWRTETHPEIDTPEKYWVARLVANKCRREVSKDEVIEYMDKLGEIYLNQGVSLGEITKRIATNTGYKLGTVQKYLSSKYKDPEKSEAGTVGRSAQLSRAPSSSSRWAVCSAPDCNILTKGEPDEAGDVYCSLHRPSPSRFEALEPESEPALEEIVELEPLPEGNFDVVYADPPWTYRVNHLRGTPPYPTMQTDEICKMGIPACDNAVLFLWTTALDLSRAKTRSGNGLGTGST